MQRYGFSGIYANLSFVFLLFAHTYTAIKQGKRKWGFAGNLTDALRIPIRYALCRPLHLQAQRQCGIIPTQLRPTSDNQQVSLGRGFLSGNQSYS